MDILLAHGYFLHEDPHEQKIMKPYPPLGLLHIASYLKGRGYAVGVFDSTFARMDSFKARLDAERPPVVGIYVNLLTKLRVLEMIRHARAAGSRVIVGGPEPAGYAEQFLEHGADVVVVGEGELTLDELLPHLAAAGPTDMGHIAGIVYRETDGQIVRTPPRPQIKQIDELPVADRAAIDIPAYLDTWRTHHGMGSISLITARGCPFKCTWCSHTVFGDTHRRRSVPLVVDEIAELIGRYQPDMLWIADDVFTINHRWIREFHAEMTRRNLRIPFECLSRADRLNEEVLKALKALGCFRIWFGSESGSQKVLDLMKRGVTVEQIRETTKLAQKYGIEAGLFVMLGYPGEEVADIRATIDHLKRTRPDQFLITVAYPLKGTPLYREVEEQLIEPGPWDARVERNLNFHGRHSDKFYEWAVMRVVEEYNLARWAAQPARHWRRLPRSFAKVQVAKVGMRLTQNTRT